MEYIEVAVERNYYGSNELKKLLNILYQEVTAPPLYYTTSEVSRGVGKEVSVGKFIQILKSLGFDSWYTHFDNRGFKTNLNICELRHILKLVVS